MALPKADSIAADQKTSPIRGGRYIKEAITLP